MKENRVEDNGDPRRYFTQIPNLIDDTEMSVYAFRLYVHLKRVTGENGKCWQGTRELAKSCNMSIGKISQSKSELNDLGLIRIETKKDEKTNNDYHEITIVDIWNKNMKRYCSPDEHPPRSGDEHPRSPHEKGCSPHERKNNPDKNNPLRITEEEGRFAYVIKELSEMLGGSVNSNSGDTVDEWLKFYPWEWVIEALQIGKDNKARSINYVTTVLENWYHDGKDRTNSKDKTNKQAKKDWKDEILEGITDE